MGLLALIHSWVDWLLLWAHLIQTRQVGWRTIDRKTGKEQREIMPLSKKIKLLLLFNPLVERIDTMHWFRWILHEQADHSRKQEDDPKSKQQIKTFVDFYNIKMSDYEPSDINAYPTFEDWFIRKHAPGSRPLYAPGDDRHAICVADSRLVTYPTIQETQRLWIKGHSFTLGNVLQDESLARPWADGGAVASFRLSPQDYHRFHCPVKGTVKWWKQMDGTYYLVDPWAVRSKVDVLNANDRSAFCLDTEEFGQVLFVAIGAAQVGKVKLHQAAMAPGSVINRMDEVGHFEFGGSSILVVFEPGRIAFDDDLLSASRRLLETSVEVGMSLGKAAKG